MATFAFSDKNDQPNRGILATALGEHLGRLTSELFSHTAKAFKGMQNIKATWIFDDVNCAWNLVVANNDKDVYTVYGMADGIVCHFFYNNSVVAQDNSHRAWIKITDDASLKLANDAITFCVK